jgi:hypothetical protein
MPRVQSPAIPRNVSGVPFITRSRITQMVLGGRSVTGLGIAGQGDSGSPTGTGRIRKKAMTLQRAAPRPEPYAGAAEALDTRSDSLEGIQSGESTHRG